MRRCGVSACWSAVFATGGAGDAVRRVGAVVGEERNPEEADGERGEGRACGEGRGEGMGEGGEGRGREGGDE